MIYLHTWLPFKQWPFRKIMGHHYFWTIPRNPMEELRSRRLCLSLLPLLSWSHHGGSGQIIAMPLWWQDQRDELKPTCHDLSCISCDPMSLNWCCVGCCPMMSSMCTFCVHILCTHSVYTLYTKWIHTAVANSMRQKKIGYHWCNYIWLVVDAKYLHEHKHGVINLSLDIGLGWCQYPTAWVSAFHNLLRIHSRFGQWAWKK